MKLPFFQSSEISSNFLKNRKVYETIAWIIAIKIKLTTYNLYPIIQIARGFARTTRAVHAADGDEPLDVRRRRVTVSRAWPAVRRRTTKRKRRYW